jgi:predicted permease
MELFITFKSSILPLFIIIAIAFVYHRFTRPDIPQIANLATIIFTPFFIFDAVLRFHFTVGMLIKPIFFMALLTMALMLVAHFTAKLVRTDEDERIALILAGSMINVGNFGLPLIYFAYGENAEAYSVLNFIAFNIPLSTVAIYMSSRESQVKKILMDIAKIPIFYSFVAALILSQLSVPIPGALEQGIRLMGSAAIPLIIFILGLQLSGIQLRLDRFRIIVPAVLIRLGISPIIALAILTWIDISDLQLNVSLVQTSAPAALLPLMYAIRFQRSPDLLATVILFTTVFSGFSLTWLIRFLG